MKKITLRLKSVLMPNILNDFNHRQIWIQEIQNKIRSIEPKSLKTGKVERKIKKSLFGSNSSIKDFIFYLIKKVKSQQYNHKFFG